jgi:hypothetical protein
MISIVILVVVEASNCRCSSIPIAECHRRIEQILRNYVRVCKAYAKPAERVQQRKAGFESVRASVRLVQQTESRFRGCSRLGCQWQGQKKLLSEMDNLLRWDLTILKNLIVHKTVGRAWDDACKSREASLKEVRRSWRRLGLGQGDETQRRTMTEFMRLSS